MQDVVDAITKAVEEALTAGMEEYGDMLLAYMAATGATQEEAVNKFTDVFLDELSKHEFPFTMTITAAKVQE
ncbi:MAG: hypothetical protein E6Q70_07025 [Pseudomonas monteilii]|nr:MAG: hypothetical protein E6Q70_07025 [Pseudomonas monteilii]